MSGFAHPPNPLPGGKRVTQGGPVFECAAALENRPFRKFPTPGGGELCVGHRLFTSEGDGLLGFVGLTRGVKTPYW